MLVTTLELPEISAVIVLHLIRGGGSYFDNGTEPYIVHSNQSTNNVAIWVQGYRNVSIVSMESSTYVQKVGIGWNGKDSTGMNPSGPIGGKRPHGARQRRFYISRRGKTIESVPGIYYLDNRISALHDETFSENAGC